MTKEYVAAEILAAIREERHDPPIGDEAKGVVDGLLKESAERRKDVDELQMQLRPAPQRISHPGFGHSSAQSQPRARAARCARVDAGLHATRGNITRAKTRGPRVGGNSRGASAIASHAFSAARPVPFRSNPTLRSRSRQSHPVFNFRADAETRSSRPRSTSRRWNTSGTRSDRTAPASKS